MSTEAGEEVKPVNWRHIKTGRMYTQLMVPVQVQIAGEWHPAVVYHADGYFYTRTLSDFAAKFERVT